MMSKSIRTFTFLYIFYFKLFLIHGQDSFPTTADIIASYGYSVESHTVSTDDGYILQMYRIPQKTNSYPLVIFMMHDIMCSSDDFVVGGPGISWAFLYSMYDCEVWLGNARGNKYSMGHTTLNTSAAYSTYWNFSWHEIGIYDLPAMIDYSLNVSGADNLQYIGHGQGTTAFFVMASMLPEYNKKINLMFAFSPTAFFGHVPSSYIRNVSHAFIENQAKMIEYSGRKFESSEKVLDDFGRSQCLNEIHDSSVCNDIYYLITGYRKDLTNVIIDKQRSCSTNQLLHYAQLVETGRFAQYNYGPDYNITNITARISIFIAENDLTFSLKDLDMFTRLQTHNAIVGNFTCRNFIHADFLNLNHKSQCVSYTN